MPAEIKLEVFGDILFRRRIQAMRFRSRDFRPVMRHMGDHLIDKVELQFETEGRASAPTTSPWKQLDPSTISRRRSAHPILVETGDLLIHMTDPENLKIDHDGFRYEIPAVIRTKAESHQYGFHNALTGNHVPARPMVVVTDLMRRKWRREIQEYLMDGRLH